LKEEALDRTM